MNLILISFPNEIYNFVDACTTAEAMWERVKRLMQGTVQNKVDRETRFSNEFDQFVSALGESLVSIYNRFAQLVNVLEQNSITFPLVIVNKKFLNYLQPEWMKYVTQVVQIVRWIVNSSCSKHMTGDRTLLEKFVEKFMGIFRFGNDHFVAITGYGDYVQGNITVFHVYYVEGLGHNLFSVGKFCDGDLEVAFHSKHAMCEI
nr:integrase, catalytic region, zinc finger, CCHC-type, peptidase aspartic, catalytic [Tanacetum cinerariifolium]